MAFISDAEYRDFRMYQAQKELTAKAEAQRAKQRQEQVQRKEDYLRNQRIDRELMTGIQAGETWRQYQRRSAAPDDLQPRYNQLAAKHQAETAQTADDMFRKGFFSCDQ